MYIKLPSGRYRAGSEVSTRFGTLIVVTIFYLESLTQIFVMDIWNIIKDAMPGSKETNAGVSEASEEPVKIRRRKRRPRQKTNEVIQVRL